MTLRVIPDNTGTPHDYLETWALRHMGREVLFAIGERESVCRKCPSYREHLSRLFIRCGQAAVSLAGGTCPQHHWGAAAAVAPARAAS